MQKQISFKRSEELFQRARKVMGGGVNSIARGLHAGWKPFPLFIERGEGAYLYDVDGNRYIDYCLALGPDLLGHANPRIVAFVSKEIKKGTIYCAPYELEIKVAEKLVHYVPSFDKVNFANAGTDAVQMALRLARAYTGKDKVIKFEGQYHGWLDNIGVSQHPPLELADDYSYPKLVPNSKLGMSPAAYENIIVLPWNDIEVLGKTIAEQKNEIAAVLTEPITCNTGVILPKKGYLETMRELTQENNIALIFDEVITGFRVALGGAQTKLNVTPDLTTMAKAIGGGFAISAYGGRKEIMELIDEGKVLHAGTLNANRTVVAAAYASLEILEENNGQVYEHLYKLGNMLMDGLREIIKEHNIPTIVQGIGPVCHVFFTDRDEITNYREALSVDKEAFAIMWRKLLEREIYLHPGPFEDMFISIAHTADDIQFTLERFDEVLREMKKEGAFQKIK